ALAGQRQLSDLRVENREIRHVRRRFGAAKHVRGSRQQLRLPVGDLGGMDAKLLGHSAHVLSPLTAAKATWALKVAS
ncbi:MAG: hypothetical protein KJS98_21325, partial [Nitrospirae bacterium]|nr:hypothetical protein [Nitrospirota bacterium]